ncbi:hypothetical protein BDZ89DRAFT_967064 [Hymenopellis radicata]|nr:hypothetical protein BDZ89DRAFT_967064 [Hymenopellis radicata]
MIGYIEKHAPEVFAIQQSDGSAFRCSESFVQKYLSRQLGWTWRRATKTAKKVPENVNEVLKEAYLREACIIRDNVIPGELRVNTDQTQIVYAQGTTTTWTERNAKQVPTTGRDEKRAFTLVPSISASGEVLPMQAIYHGQTTTSCPSRSAPSYDDAMDLGLRLLPSKSTTYWSTQETMRDLVDNIIAPYFDEKKKELNCDVSQKSLWKIDCWSVHKSREFLDWMKTSHPTIIICFVPGCCTGLWQPLDVGIQRVMKLAIKRASHRDVVAEISAQLDADPDGVIRLDMSIGTLRDRSVGWIVAAIRDISDREFVQKV